MNQTAVIRSAEELSAALETARPGQTLELGAGIFRGKWTIRTPGLTLRGAGQDKTVLVGDDYALKKDEQGRDYVTFRTWTLAVCADGVSMEALSVVNDAGSPELKGQEVALTVYGDEFTMRRCGLRSTQDTLFLGPLPRDLIARYEGFLPDELRLDKPCRQRFEDCVIAGSVDFIFGCGEALFENCELVSVNDARNVGYVAAPSHALEQTRGFLFRRCRFTAEPGVAPATIWLARPWRDYGLSVFEDCAYGPHIHPLGFDKWNDTHRDETARFYESPAVPGRQPWVNRPARTK